MYCDDTLAAVQLTPLHAIPPRPHLNILTNAPALPPPTQTPPLTVFCMCMWITVCYYPNLFLIATHLQLLRYIYWQWVVNEVRLLFHSFLSEWGASFMCVLGSTLVYMVYMALLYSSIDAWPRRHHL